MIFFSLVLCSYMLLTVYFKPKDKSCQERFGVDWCAYCSEVLASLVQCISLDWTEIHCIVLRSNAMHCTTLHCTKHKYNWPKCNAYRAKTENPYHFSHFLIPRVTKLTLTLIFKGINCAVFLFFCSSAIGH